jgi:hypothetical protein
MTVEPDTRDQVDRWTPQRDARESAGSMMGLEARTPELVGRRPARGSM